MSGRVWHWLFHAGLVGLGWSIGSTHPVSGAALTVLAVMSLVAVAVPTHVWLDRRVTADGRADQ